MKILLKLKKYIKIKSYQILPVQFQIQKKVTTQNLAVAQISDFMHTYIYRVFFFFPAWNDTICVALPVFFSFNE